MKRILLVAQESPFPARHGGTIDMSRRLLAMLEAGSDIFLICWAEDPAAAREACRSSIAATGGDAALERFQLEALPYERSVATRLRNAASLARLPAPVAMTRHLDPSRYRELLAESRRFVADAVFIDGIFAGGLGRSLARDLQLSYLYRSHNREHDYYRRQIAAAPSLQSRLKLQARALSIGPFERSLVREAAGFFDISMSDLDAWRAEGLGNGRWLPPLAHWHANGTAVVAYAPSFDIAFVGNLYMPNNVQGVMWLLDEVLPVLRRSRPGASLVIAGSKPVAAVTEAVSRASNVTLLPDVADPSAVLASARVLVNPVLVGSGVMLKLIDMLMTDKPIVTTPQGAAGLPDDVLTTLRVAADAPAFAGELAAALEDGHFDLALRRKSRAHFSPAAILPVLESIPSARAGRVTEAP